MTGDDEGESGYVIKVGAGFVRSDASNSCRSKTSRRHPTTSSRRRSWEPTNAASGPSRCPGCSDSPASTGFPSIRCCPTTTNSASLRPTETPLSTDRPGPPPSRNPGPAGHRTDRGARGRDAQAVPTHHPMAAGRLQRPHAHHPPRRPANGRMHLRLPSGAGACPARQPSAPPGPIDFAASGSRPCSRGRPSRAGHSTTPTPPRRNPGTERAPTARSPCSIRRVRGAARRRRTGSR